MNSSPIVRARVYVGIYIYIISLTMWLNHRYAQREMHLRTSDKSDQVQINYISPLEAFLHQLSHQPNRIIRNVYRNCIRALLVNVRFDYQLKRRL